MKEKVIIARSDFYNIYSERLLSKDKKYTYTFCNDLITYKEKVLIVDDWGDSHMFKEEKILFFFTSNPWKEFRIVRNNTNSITIISDRIMDYKRRFDNIISIYNRRSS